MSSVLLANKGEESVTSSNASVNRRSIVTNEQLNSNLNDVNSVILCEDFSSDFLVTGQDVDEYAEQLGLTKEDSQNIRSPLAKSLSLPLPQGWTAVQNGDGIYYFDYNTGTSSWQHPVDLTIKQFIEGNKNSNKFAEEFGAFVDNLQVSHTNFTDCTNNPTDSAIEISNWSNDSVVSQDSRSDEDRKLFDGSKLIMANSELVELPKEGLPGTRHARLQSLNTPSSVTSSKLLPLSTKTQSSISSGLGSWLSPHTKPALETSTLPSPKSSDISSIPNKNLTPLKPLTGKLTPLPMDLKKSRSSLEKQTQSLLKTEVSGLKSLPKPLASSAMEDMKKPLKSVPNSNLTPKPILKDPVVISRATTDTDRLLMDSPRNKNIRFQFNTDQLEFELSESSLSGKSSRIDPKSKLNQDNSNTNNQRTSEINHEKDELFSNAVDPWIQEKLSTRPPSSNMPQLEPVGEKSPIKPATSLVTKAPTKPNTTISNSKTTEPKIQAPTAVESNLGTSRNKPSEPVTRRLIKISTDYQDTSTTEPSDTNETISGKNPNEVEDSEGILPNKTMLSQDYPIQNQGNTDRMQPNARKVVLISKRVESTMRKNEPKSDEVKLNSNKIQQDTKNMESPVQLELETPNTPKRNKSTILSLKKHLDKQVHNTSMKKVDSTVSEPTSSPSAHSMNDFNEYRKSSGSHTLSSDSEEISRQKSPVIGHDPGGTSKAPNQYNRLPKATKVTYKKEQKHQGQESISPDIKRLWTGISPEIQKEEHIIVIKELTNLIQTIIAQSIHQKKECHHESPPQMITNQPQESSAVKRHEIKSAEDQQTLRQRYHEKELRKIKNNLAEILNNDDSCDIHDSGSNELPITHIRASSETAENSTPILKELHELLTALAERKVPMSELPLENKNHAIPNSEQKSHSCRYQSKYTNIRRKYSSLIEKIKKNRVKIASTRLKPEETPDQSSSSSCSVSAHNGDANESELAVSDSMSQKDILTPEYTVDNSYNMLNPDAIESWIRNDILNEPHYSDGVQQNFNYGYTERGISFPEQILSEIETQNLEFSQPTSLRFGKIYQAPAKRFLTQDTQTYYPTDVKILDEPNYLEIEAGKLQKYYNKLSNSIPNPQNVYATHTEELEKELQSSMMRKHQSTEILPEYNTDFTKTPSSSLLFQRIEGLKTWLLESQKQTKLYFIQKT